MDGAALVQKRRTAMAVMALGMACDAQELPTPSDDSRPVGWWLAEQSSYQGTAAPEADWPTDPQITTCDGTTALAVTAERVFGIVSPNDETTPAVWWSWSLPKLNIQAAGSQGLFKKRPTAITLKLDGATVELSVVSRLYRNSGRYQTGQEGSLVKALVI